MRRYLTLVFMLLLAIPAGISFSGCVRNPAGNYCNGLGYGTKDTDVYTIVLQPQTTGVSMAFGQTRQINAPTALTCKNVSASVSSYTYGTTNNLLLDISPSGNMCAGTWNRNSGGGINDYTICNLPSPLPSTGGLPYGTVTITASASSVTSNPVTVYVHAPVSSINLALSGTQQCYSQGATTQLDSEACFVSNNKQYELCAPPTVTHYTCAAGLPPGVTSVPDCTSAIGALSYSIGSSSVATLNSATNAITALQPGTTAITAQVAGSGASAGYFSTCPPKSITVSLNGGTNATVTQGVTQNMATTVIDTNNQTITGLTLDYQSTNPMDISVSSTGAVAPSFPGAASVYAVCQPTTCNPSPINEVGLYGTGLPITSNPVDVTTPGTASAYVWFSSPGQSQYFVPIDLLTGAVGSNVRLPYVPNSMVMDRLGNDLYFGSSHGIMIYSTANDSAVRATDTSVPGVVLAVSPANSSILINDQVRKVFYIYNSSGSITATFAGVGSTAEWTPDSKTLYISDSASLGPNHSDTLYVFNVNTGWTTYPLPAGPSSWYTNETPRNLAITIPSVGAYMSGNPTVAHTWCPSGTINNYASQVFYPQGDSVNAQTDQLAATTDGNHILGAAAIGGEITLSDINFPAGISTGVCPEAAGGVLQALTLTHTLTQAPVTVNATAVNQVVTSPTASSQGAITASSSLSFITYNGATAGAKLPYYKQVSGPSSNLGTLGYITLMNGSAASTAVTAPIAGVFSPDGTLFFVSTAGDNMIHYISTTSLTDTQQVSPGLPACAPGSDPDCTITSPATTVVPATVITVKARATT